jgi:cytidine deaminase
MTTRGYCLTVNEPRDIPWSELRTLAREATTRAYAPYSRVLVGAAALTTSGIHVVGSNVENASYGLTLCAECSLVSDLVRHGGGRLLALCVVAGDGQTLTPCGRCRQVLFEHAGASLLIDRGDADAPLTLGELLPLAFGPDDLATRSAP